MLTKLLTKLGSFSPPVSKRRKGILAAGPKQACYEKCEEDPFCKYFAWRSDGLGCRTYEECTKWGQREESSLSTFAMSFRVPFQVCGVPVPAEPRISLDVAERILNVF